MSCPREPWGPVGCCGGSLDTRGSDKQRQAVWVRAGLQGAAGGRKGCEGPGEVARGRGGPHGVAGSRGGGW
jgi:hypothetical protein